MGLPGPELTDGLRDLIRRVQPGGFIFFTRNMAEAGQFHGLVKEIDSIQPKEICKGCGFLKSCIKYGINKSFVKDIKI